MNPTDLEGSISVPGGSGDRTLMRLVIALLAWIGLGLIAYGAVAAGLMTATDVQILEWFAAHRSAALTAMAQVTSLTGGPSATSVYAGILVVVCLVRRQPATAVGISVIVYGAGWLNVVIKNLAERARPVAGQPLVTLSTYSFPSGHAAASAVFGGLLIMFAVRGPAPAGARRIVLAAIALWIVSVCVSRVYLGAHYPTDVLGGVLEGVGWIMTSSAVLDRLGIPVAWPSRSA